MALDPNAGFPGCGSGGGGTSRPVQSFDPNDKFGPAGFGPAGFVAPGGTFPYRIDFENEATATAPAQVVIVTDQLDPNLDWNTFQLTEVGFGDNTISIPSGSQHFQTTVPMTFNGQTFQVQIELGLNSQTGLVTATFQSIDPRTQLPPDVLTGFLPPENGTGRGMGHFSYTVSPKANLLTGTQIRNVATITFDSNLPITTDQVDPHDPSKGIDPAKQDLNTIDVGPPTSGVSPLAAVTNSATFPVSWSGQDDAGGSGIASYDVYVSVDGGAFSRWLAGTTQRSAAYSGAFGHTYAFFSVATDNVGNQEVLPTGAQTTTRLVAPPPPPPPPPGPGVPPVLPPLSGDVTGVVRVAAGKVTHRGRRSRQTVVLTNTSGQALAGPVSLVLVGLPRQVRLVGAAGGPFVDVAPGLDAGASITVLLQFRGPVPGRLHYVARIVAGTGAR
jgi:hypothetical protein